MARPRALIFPKAAILCAVLATPWRSVAEQPGVPACPKEPARAGNADHIAFRDRVLAAHLDRNKKRAPQRDLREDELEPVPGTKVRSRRDTAKAAGRLLAAANADLAAAKEAGDADALRTVTLTANSGYRNRARQQEVWIRNFSCGDSYYERTRKAREALADGPHSVAAISYMLRSEAEGGFALGSRTAAPGYSNHQSGIAIDFFQHRIGGHDVANSTRPASRKIWRSTWFHRWMLANAARFGFNPYAKEEWHWEYRPAVAPTGTSTRGSTR